MADTAAQVLTESKALLNDLGGVFYTSDSLLPYLNKAYRELQDYFNLHGLRTTVDVAGIMVIPAGLIAITTPPADMLRPIELAERQPGSTDPFMDMDERSWEPDEKQTTHLRFWVWREEQIHFLGATTEREVRIRYVKSLAALSGEGSLIAILNSKSALAARTASLAARFMGENPTRADELDADVSMALDRLIVTAIRQNQGMPARRRRTRYRRPN
jgi:hypothetical protein